MLINNTMPKQENSILMNLIRKMTKAEKRRFKLMSGAGKGSETKLFVELFDVLDDMDSYDERLIFKKIPRLKKAQLSNLKAHLLKHLMSNLRHLHIPTKLDIQVRDLIDYARVYYSKGMYKAALQTLHKAKKIAMQHELNTALFTCVEFEKKIESQHITGSMYPRAEALSIEVETALNQVVLNNKLSNLALRLYGKYLKQSHIKHETDYKEHLSYFKANLPKVNFETLDFYGKLYYLQSHVWFCYTVQDFANYFKHAYRWVEHFQNNAGMIDQETAMYLKGVHNLLNAYFIHEKEHKFLDTYHSFLQYKSENLQDFDLNCLQIIHNIEWIHGLNVYILEADFDKGAIYVDGLVKHSGYLIQQWNLHRLLTIYYKMACIYFGAERFDEALEYLNIINNRVYPEFRNDIQCFSRILSLIIHYDLGHHELLKYQVQSVYRFLLKLDEMQEVQKEIFNFLRKLPRMNNKDVIAEFGLLKNRLVSIRNLKFEKRAFLYLDIISWLSSKIENCRIQEIIQQKKLVKS